jgi:Flp pilus assembly protein TadG
MKFVKNNQGAAAVEFALVALPVFVFIFGIMQTAYIVWVDNLLHVAVDTASRCGAINSTTAPCQGSTGMIQTATRAFQPLTATARTFTINSGCSTDGGTGLQGSGVTGTYNISIGWIKALQVNLTITAESCYPTIPTCDAAGSCNS